MKTDEKTLISDVKEMVVWSYHMARAAMGLYEEQKYYDMVKQSGHDAEYYDGVSEAYNAILLQLIGGKELMKLHAELIDGCKDEEELN